MKFLRMISAYRSMPNSKKNKIKNQFSVAGFGLILGFVAFTLVADPSIEEEPDGRFLITQYSQLISEERIVNLAERHCFEMGLAMSGYKIEKSIRSGGGVFGAGTRYYHYFSCN